MRHGWRTGAIVPELEQETKVVCTDRYALNLTWLQAVTGLLEQLQVRKKTSEVFQQNKMSVMLCQRLILNFRKEIYFYMCEKILKNTNHHFKKKSLAPPSGSSTLWESLV